MDADATNILKAAGTGAGIGAFAGPVGAAVGAGAGALIGTTQYLVNKHNQKKDEKNRPQYQIPEEISQNLTDAQRYAVQSGMEGMPEEQKAQYLSNLQRSTAYGLNQLSSRRSGNLLAQDAGQRVQNQRYGQQLVSAAQQNMANYKDMQWDANVRSPYYEKIASRNANNGALAQNLDKSAQLGMYAMQPGTPSAPISYPTNTESYR